MRIEGHGSVEQLEKSKKRGKCRKWQLWVRAGGKNKSRRFNGTYREAQAALEEFKAEVEAIVPNSESFRTYATSWADYRRDSERYDPNTLAKDYYHVRALSIAIGDMAMEDITPEVCRDALTRIKHGENASGRELSNTTLACDTRGGLLLPQNLYRWWHGNHNHKGGVRGGLGCPDMVLHELRYSNLTMMARHLSPFDLQRYVGWSSLEPARVYIHEDLESVMKGVEDAWKVMA